MSITDVMSLIGVAIVFALGCLVGYIWRPETSKLEHIDALDLTKQYTLEESREMFYETPIEALKPEDFAVARGPRHIPWSRRKKELEASARQKRRQLESFREEA